MWLLVTRVCARDCPHFGSHLPVEFFNGERTLDMPQPYPKEFRADVIAVARKGEVDELFAVTAR